MHNFEFVKMSDTRRDLLERALRVEVPCQSRECRGLVNQVEQRSWTKLKSDVEKSVALLLAEVSNNVRVIVRLLQQIDLVRCDSDEIFEKALYGDCSPLKLAAQHDGAVGAVP